MSTAFWYEASRSRTIDGTLWLDHFGSSIERESKVKENRQTGANQPDKLVGVSSDPLIFIFVNLPWLLKLI